MTLEDLKDKSIAVYGAGAFDVDSFDDAVSVLGAKVCFIVDDYKDGKCGEYNYIKPHDLLAENIDIVVIPSQRDEVVSAIESKCVALGVKNFVALKKEKELSSEIFSQMPPEDTIINPNNYELIFNGTTKLNTILFDSLANCNIKCVYCHCIAEDRSNKKIPLDEFESFMSRVERFRSFQVGCAYEPCVDSRMNEFIKVIARNIKKPLIEFRLQTNGTLLHKHDFGIMRDAGLNMLNISLDSVDKNTLEFMRGGTELDRVVQNVKAIRNAIPSLNLRIVSVISSKNADMMEDVVKFGLDNGAVDFNFRQMEPTFIEDEKLRQEMMMSEAQQEMLLALIEKYKTKTRIAYYSYDELINRHKKQYAESGFKE